MLMAPVPGSGAGVRLVTVTSDQLSSWPAKSPSTSTSWSPALIPLTGPASRTPLGAPFVSWSVVSGASVTGMLDGPVKLAAVSTSKVCDATSGVATLDRRMPTGMTSGSVVLPGVRSAATYPVAAIAGAGW